MKSVPVNNTRKDYILALTLSILSPLMKDTGGDITRYSKWMIEWQDWTIHAIDS